MKISISDFGTAPDGRTASLITIWNTRGTRLVLTDFGARIVGLALGGDEDIVTRFASPQAYAAEGRYHGAVIGRYANRISGAEFTLNGRRFSLCANDGENSLHGGHTGFDCRMWEYSLTDGGVTFSLVSPDGDEGYPGTLSVSAAYALLDDDTVRIAYCARSDADTVINLTNHTYFNLDGFKNDILKHTLELCADAYTESDAALIPTGRILPAAGTAMDFTAPRAIGERIDDRLLADAGGYDHNFVIRGAGFRRFARVRGNGGLVMEAYSDMPGVQFYTGNFLSGERGAALRYVKHSAFCLETQFYPDSMAHEGFPSPVLKAGKEFKSRTEYRFVRAKTE